MVSMRSEQEGNASETEVAGLSADAFARGLLTAVQAENLRFPLIDRFAVGNFKVFHLGTELRRHPKTRALHRYSVLDCPHWVNVVARTETGHYLFVQQWRAGTDEVTLEIPGGMVDPGEAPLKAAHRELVEETGYQGKSSDIIGRVNPNPAIQNNICTTVLVEGCSFIAKPNLDPGEMIEICTLSPDEVREALGNGQIRHALVVAAFAHLMLKGKF